MLTFFFDLFMTRQVLFGYFLILFCPLLSLFRCIYNLNRPFLHLPRGASQTFQVRLHVCSAVAFGLPIFLFPYKIQLLLRVMLLILPVEDDHDISLVRIFIGFLCTDKVDKANLLPLVV